MYGAVCRVRVAVEGRVHGVNFRAFTSEHARSLGLKGYVKNLPDGSVEAVIEGDPEGVERLVEALKEGPPAACVTGLRVEEEKPTGEFVDFEIRR
ncbi:MAG: acylphosphatase [Nitrospirota bacterium]|nr:acylphosphatase [Nitrospirota bacterium]